MLTGHLLKDPDATVAYHTGINMKKATPPPVEEPKGELANRPIQVADNLDSICRVLESHTPTVARDQAPAFPSIAPLVIEH